jgi:hypothetical protein
MADYLFDTTVVPRSYSGSQMGRRSAFENVTSLIDDDYLYRNEDIIIATLIQRAGYRYGKVGETHHFHQVMHKPSRWRRAVKRVAVELELGRDEDVRANRTYAQGIVKYLTPLEAPPDLTASVREAVKRLAELDDMSEAEFLSWVKDTNPAWLRELAPVSPEAAVIPVRQESRRDRTAERLHYFAELYRDRGGPGAMLVLVKRILRAMLPMSLHRHVRRIPFYARFYSGRIATEYRTGGAYGVFDLFKRNIVRRR